MAESFVEREQKFEVRPDFELPDLTGAVPPGSSTIRSLQQLRSDYFDTAEHALQDAGITFRRRSGSDDTGWHLKVPHGEHREELRAPLSTEQPAELTGMLLGLTRGAPLVPVATLRTERHVTRVVDAAGDPVADIDLDDVLATVNKDGQSTFTSWTELEIELGSPSVSEEQLAVLARLVRDAGARPSSSSSKLSRALAAAAPKQPRSKTKSRRKRPAGHVLMPYLADQRAALLRGDLALRRGDDAVIHKTRVATRRFRSTLRVFSPFFEADRIARLDEELAWYAELLGAVRDGQVLERRLDDLVRELPPELVLGPVQQRIDAHLEANRARDWALLQSELVGTRYLALLTDLASWADAPPFTPLASSGDRAVVRLVRKAEKKVSARLKEANRSGDVDQLHRARKSAKRARYAAEAAKPIEGKRASSEAKQYEQLQDLLGEHQDSVVAAALLRELGAAAGVTPGENGFTFGLLFQKEQERADAARRQARKVARQYR